MAELVWQKPSLNGTAPSSRGGHTAVLADTQLVIFGGHRYGGDGVFEYFNDVHVLVRCFAPMFPRMPAPFFATCLCFWDA